MVQGKRLRNHLLDEKSPYLQQHANNPVDWYPWGKEAFEKAKAECKPIFLSIGYSTCHWCHVMARESFEDEDVARLMNDNFVSIKVDREERPDIDSYYMTVCQILTGTGGWPLTIVMSPEKIAFFAATYLPKESRYGHAGLIQLIPKIASAWRDQQGDIIKSAEEISEYMKSRISYGSGKEIDAGIIQQAYYALRDSYDPAAGGFGNAPKFPTPQNISFLLRYFLNTGDDGSLKMVEHTLRAMRMGSVYDQIGFGFHRYSTDSYWRLPHFEKMIYDQALMIIVYGDAFQITRKNIYSDTALEIIDYVLRDMQSREGVFYSAEDADSEGREGKYYLWTEHEMKETLTPEEFDLAAKVYNIQDDGNYEDERSRKRNGLNLLYRSHDDEEMAMELGIPIEEYAKRTRSVRSKLLARRTARIRPQKDNKVLCDWNGLMIAALSKASRMFGDARSGIEARRAADFILTKMRTSDGRLYHRYIDGQVAINGFLEDYAFLVWGLIELYQVDFISSYLTIALELTELCSTLFWDEEHGAFFSTSECGELPVRKKETHDGATPSGNSVAAHNLIRLARMTGRHVLEERAHMIFNSIGGDIQENPLGHVHMLTSFWQVLSPASNIVISGTRDNDLTIEMLRTIRNSKWIDISTTMLPANCLGEMTKITEFAREYRQIGGRTTVYVCRGHECNRPTTDAEELSSILEMRAD